PHTKYCRNIIAESFKRILEDIAIASPACWFPGPECDGWNECIEARRRKLDRAALLSAVIPSHQEFYHFQTVFESQRGLLVLQKRFYEMAIFPLISVCRSLIGDYGHLSDLCVLFFDKVLASFALHLTAEKQLQPALKGVPRHRILGAEQLS